MRTKEKVLRPVRPNAGIEATYRAQLDRLIKEMQASTVYWLTASYRASEPRVAQDATPADALKASIRKLSSRWIKRFDAASIKLARYFGTAVEKRSSAALRKILKDAGLSVEFTLTPAMRDVLDATVNANVALIKSIPAQYFEQVEGLVMRSVQTGRDLGGLTKDLEARYGITRRRAAFIARDQNDKATAAMNRVRQLEVAGDEAEADWLHSGGGKHPRPTHVAAGRQRVRYRVKQGWYDPAVKKFIQPSEEPGCRCVGRLVMKGFS